MSSPSALERSRSVLARSHEQSAQIVEYARERGAEIEREGELAALQLAHLRVRSLRELRAALEHHAREIDLAYARMTETLAEIADRLARIAAEADFSPPMPPSALERTIELRLTETREVTLKLSSRGTDAAERA